MKIGVVAPVELGVTAEPDKILEFARAAERLGFSEISVVEHAVVIGDTQSTYPYSPTGQSHLPDDIDIPDPLELLVLCRGRYYHPGIIHRRTGATRSPPRGAGQTSGHPGPAQSRAVADLRGRRMDA